jgi:hypothetical protein
MKASAVPSRQRLECWAPLSMSTLFDLPVCAFFDFVLV